VLAALGVETNEAEGEPFALPAPEHHGLRACASCVGCQAVLCAVQSSAWDCSKSGTLSAARLRRCHHGPSRRVLGPARDRTTLRLTGKQALKLVLSP
jgi:hypothetical protein